MLATRSVVNSVVSPRERLSCNESAVLSYEDIDFSKTPTHLAVTEAQYVD